MSGHRHNPSAATQNQGNALGDRACVRQSKLYRVHESGNDVKALLGTSHLCWDTTQKQGAYAGHKVYDHTQDDPLGVHHIHAAAQEQSKYGRMRGQDRKEGTGNFYSGYGNESETDYRRGPVAGKPEPRRQSGGGHFETTSSGYGREGSDRIGKYGYGDEGNRGNGYERRGNDYDYDQDQGGYGRRASFDREPQHGGRRSSFNDENVYSEKNKLSHYSAGNGGYDGPNKYKDDRNYRSMREQMDNSSYQRAPQPEMERTAIRTYRGKDKDTRPW